MLAPPDSRQDIAFPDVLFFRHMVASSRRSARPLGEAQHMVATATGLSGGHCFRNNAVSCHQPFQSCCRVLIVFAPLQRLIRTGWYNRQNDVGGVFFSFFKPDAQLYTQAACSGVGTHANAQGKRVKGSRAARWRRSPTAASVGSAPPPPPWPPQERKQAVYARELAYRA